MTNIGQVSRYGSNESRNGSTGSLGTFLRGVKRGLPFLNYEVKLQDALETENLAKEKFTISIYQEVCFMTSNGTVLAILNPLHILYTSRFFRHRYQK